MSQRIFEQDQETPEGTINDTSMLVAYGGLGKNTLNITWDSFLIWVKTQLNLVPQGTIWMWSGTVPPSGYGLCDGEDDKPDLRGRFIVGAGSSYSVRETGGEKTHILTTDEIPAHTHTISQANNTQTKSYLSGTPFFNTKTVSSTEAISTTSAGSSSSHENRPPYYVLAFIIKL